MNRLIHAKRRGQCWRSDCPSGAAGSPHPVTELCDDKVTWDDGNDGETPHTLAVDIITQAATLLDEGKSGQHMAVTIRDADGAKLGEHYAPLRLALLLMEGMHQVDLSSDDAGDSVPVDTSGFYSVHVYVM